jgi:hypothetical protein
VDCKEASLDPLKPPVYLKSSLKPWVGMLSSHSRIKTLTLSNFNRPDQDLNILTLGTPHAIDKRAAIAQPTASDSS